MRTSGELFAGRFAIERVAGSGGMGTVYAARDLHTDRPVALKLLQLSGNFTGDIERFSREAAVLAELDHPGIVSHVAHGTAPDGQRYLAMEWLQGEDLGQRLRRGPLPITDTLTLIRQTASALALAHHRGVVHRDTTRKNKLCSLAGHKATHRRRTDHAHALHPHSPH
jgi:serine/threonine protein kinase